MPTPELLVGTVVTAKATFIHGDYQIKAKVTEGQIVPTPDHSAKSIVLENGTRVEYSSDQDLLKDWEIRSSGRL